VVSLSEASDHSVSGAQDKQGTPEKHKSKVFQAGNYRAPKLAIRPRYGRGRHHKVPGGDGVRGAAVRPHRELRSAMVGRHARWNSLEKHRVRGARDQVSNQLQRREDLRKLRQRRGPEEVLALLHAVPGPDVPGKREKMRFLRLLQCRPTAAQCRIRQRVLGSQHTQVGRDLFL
jgi:hypothetical protein